jgi:hypothetical protein
MNQEGGNRLDQQWSDLDKSIRTAASISLDCSSKSGRLHARFANCHLDAKRPYNIAKGGIVMTDDLQMPTLRQLWRRWRDRDRDHDSHDTPTISAQRRNRPPLPSKSEPPLVQTVATWAQVQQTVRQWPSGMPVTSDLLAQVFGVGRGQAWRWLERLERAGLIYTTTDAPNRHGERKKRRWVV